MSLIDGSALYGSGSWMVRVVGNCPGTSITCPVSYTSSTRKKSNESQLSRLASETFPSNQHPRKPITALQSPSINRLNENLGLPFGDHDSQIAVTLGTGALEISGHGLLKDGAAITSPARRVKPVVRSLSCSIFSSALWFRIKNFGRRHAYVLCASTEIPP